MRIFAENLIMNTFLDKDKIECVLVSEAKIEYPKLDWSSQHIQGKTWDSRYTPDNRGQLIRGELVQIMALEDLKTLAEE